MKMKTSATMKLVLQATDVKNSVNTFQLSKKYVKRLVKISVLNLIYQRIAIPEKEFEVKKYESIPYRVFKRKSENSFIRIYHSVATGIIDALDKDYLKEIVMHIIGKDNIDPLETYTIKIKYNKQDSKSDQNSSAVKAATMDYFRALTELPGTKYEEDNVQIFFELSYNADAPSEYEPPNFEATKELVGSGSNSLISLGQISTGFHKVSTWAKGINFAESRPTTPAISNITPAANVVNDLLLEENNEEICEMKRKNNPTTRENGSKKRKLKTHSKIQSSVGPLSTTGEVDWHNISIASSEEDVYCPCKWRLPEKYETIKCTKCCARVHLACHGFMSVEAIDANNFTCFACSSAKADKTQLNKLNLLMKMRAIIYGITLGKSIPCELQLATKDEATYILEQLEVLGVINSSSTSLRDINIKALNNAVLSVFNGDDSQSFF